MLSGPKCAHRLYVLIITIGAATSLAMRYGGVDLNVGYDLDLNGISTCVKTDTESCSGFACVRPK